MVSKQPENVVLLAFHFAGKWNKNKFSGHIHSMPINLFNFAWVNFHCAPRHFSPVLSTPVSLVSTQQSRSPDSEPRRIWKEVGFSFPLTGKQGLKCVYCPHAQYSGYEDSPGDTLSCTFTLACTPIYVCVCLSPNIQLEYSSSLSHPILKSAKSWCPDVRPGRWHSLG